MLLPTVPGPALTRCATLSSLHSTGHLRSAQVLVAWPSLVGALLITRSYGCPLDIPIWCSRCSQLFYKGSGAAYQLCSPCVSLRAAAMGCRSERIGMTLCFQHSRQACLLALCCRPPCSVRVGERCGCYFDRIVGGLWLGVTF